MGLDGNADLLADRVADMGAQRHRLVGTLGDDAERPWFQNPVWPENFADYAQAFSERYPHVRYYTPVNEIYVTAQFSAAFGWWNERLMSDAAFITNIKHCCRASILAMAAGLSIIFAGGVAWLAATVGLAAALATGLYPFIVVDAIKIVAAGLVLPTAWRFLR